MIKIRQEFITNSIQDIPDTIKSEFKTFKPEQFITPGQTVAITAGSRGINNIDVITREIVTGLKQIGALPFIVPAMGSHGGATADGQLEVLDHYGITETAMAAPIKSSMAVVQVGETEEGFPVYIDKIASQADHIVVVNRIKTHTDFEAPIESGLMKMLAIGLGKQEAADKYHLEFINHGYYPIIVSVAREILKKCHIAFGVGIVENQKEETEIIKLIHKEKIEKTEEELLTKAKDIFSRIPFSPIDLLIVDEIGKIYSGTGMDQNVIARSNVPTHIVPTKPQIARIFVRDLATASGGNASGIGNADFTTQRLVDKINRDASYVNVITAVGPELIRVPIHFNTDREVLDAASKVIPNFTPEAARIVRIKNTLDLEEMLISETMIPEVEKIKNISFVGSPKSVKFDHSGNLE